MGKESTQKVEREHVSLRGRSSGLVREGIYFSKGQCMHNIVIALVITSGFSKELFGKQHLSLTTATIRGQYYFRRTCRCAYAFGIPPVPYPFYRTLSSVRAHANADQTVMFKAGIDAQGRGFSQFR
jgi:hypothetical protein